MCFQTEGSGGFEIGVFVSFFLPIQHLYLPPILTYVDVQESLSCVDGIGSLPTVSFTLLNLKKKAVLINGFNNKITSGNHGS